MRAALTLTVLVFALALPQIWLLSRAAPDADVLPRVAAPEAARPGSWVRRHLGPAETGEFMERHRALPALSAYLDEPARTPWGVVLENDQGSFLVVVDARFAAHVIDVTGDPIADEIAKPRLRSPQFEIVGLP
jgi:hypothetical protein